MKKIKNKKLIIFLLSVFVILQTGVVFALEADYPSIMGFQVTGESFPEYAAYLFNIGIGIAFLLAAGVIAFGGVYYLISFSRGSFTSEAKEWIKAGILGLLIVLCAYLIAYTINPALVFFKLGDLLPVDFDSLFNGGGQTGIQQEIYNEIPVGILTENLLARGIDCYDFDFIGDPIEGEEIKTDDNKKIKGPTFLNKDRLICVQKLGEAFEKKSEIVNELSNKIAELMEQCYCYGNCNYDCSTCRYPNPNHCPRPSSYVGKEDLCTGDCKSAPCKASEDPCPPGVREKIEKGPIKINIGEEENENCPPAEKEYEGLKEFKPGSLSISDLIEEKVMYNGKEITVINIKKWHSLKLIEQLMYLEEKIERIKQEIERDAQELQRAKSAVSRCYLAKSYVDFIKIKEQTKEDQKKIGISKSFIDPVTQQEIDISNYCKGHKYESAQCFQFCDDICPGISATDIANYKKCNSCESINDPQQMETCLFEQMLCMKNYYNQRSCSYTVSGQKPANFQSCMYSCIGEGLAECCENQTSCSEKECFNYSKEFLDCRLLGEQNYEKCVKNCKSNTDCQFTCKEILNGFQSQCLNNYYERIGNPSDSFKSCAEKWANDSYSLWEKQQCCYIDFHKLRYCAEYSNNLESFENCQNQAYTCKFCTDQTTDNYFYPNYCPFCVDNPAWITVYAHLDRIDVFPGQEVQRGDLIGEIGAVGTNMGPHLHFIAGIEIPGWKDYLDSGISINIYPKLNLKNKKGKEAPNRQQTFLPIGCIDEKYKKNILDTIEPPVNLGYCNWQELLGSVMHTNNAYWAQDWICAEGEKKTESAEVYVMSGGPNIKSTVIYAGKQHTVIIKHEYINPPGSSLNTSSQNQEKISLRTVDAECREYAYNDDPLTFYCLPTYFLTEEAKNEDPLGLQRRYSPNDEVFIGETVDKSLKWAEEANRAIEDFLRKTREFINYIEKIGKEKDYCKCDSKCGDGKNACETKCIFRQSKEDVLDEDGNKIGEEWNCWCQKIPCDGNPCHKILNMIYGKTADEDCPKGVEYKGVEWYYNQVKEDLIKIKNYILNNDRSNLLKLLSFSRKKTDECSTKAKAYGKEMRLLPCQRIEHELISPIELKTTTIDSRKIDNYCYGQNLNIITGKSLMDNWFCAEQWDGGEGEAGVLK
jgi:hypothetical protein